MSMTRRMIAAGLPAAGVTVLAALSLPTPASAVPADAAGVRPMVMATPCAEGYHRNCTAGQGYGTPSTPGGAAPTTAGTPGTHTATAHTRGHGGYGGTSPATTSPSPSSSATPSAHVDTVPPGGVSPSSA